MAVSLSFQLCAVLPLYFYSHQLSDWLRACRKCVRYSPKIDVNGPSNCSDKERTKSVADRRRVSESDPSKSRRIYSIGSSSNNSSSDSKHQYQVIKWNLPRSCMLGKMIFSQMERSASGLSNSVLCRACLATLARKVIAVLTSYNSISN